MFTCSVGIGTHSVNQQPIHPYFLESFSLIVLTAVTMLDQLSLILVVGFKIKLLVQRRDLLPWKFIGDRFLRKEGQRFILILRDEQYPDI